MYSMTKTKCWLCLRIKASDVVKVIHSFPLIGDKQKVHEIVSMAVSLVEKGYNFDRALFCGKSKFRIIGGLVYTMFLHFPEIIDFQKKLLFRKGISKEFKEFSHRCEYREFFPKDITYDRMTQFEVAYVLVSLFEEMIEEKKLKKILSYTHITRKGAKDWEKIFQSFKGELRNE